MSKHFNQMYHTNPLQSEPLGRHWSEIKDDGRQNTRLVTGLYSHSKRGVKPSMNENFQTFS